MTKAPIDKRKTPRKTVTTKVFPSAIVPASLSSIYVPRKPSPVTTDYIIPTVEIDSKGFYSDMCSGYPYNIIATNYSEEAFFFSYLFYGNKIFLFLLL